MFESLRFNRYIVECKYMCVIHINSDGIGFNRYIVECKSGSVYRGVAYEFWI